MKWTEWRRLASGHNWYDDEFDYDGPACYELGTGVPRGGQIEPHYVGETVCEKRRMSSYARGGNNRVWNLFYNRARRKLTRAFRFSRHTIRAATGDNSECLHFFS